jgi:hypothetical protein
MLYSIARRNDVVALLGRTSNVPSGSAIVFPFYLPDAVEPYGYRLRPDKPRVMRTEGGRDRPVKYDQASGSGAGTFVYYPWGARSRRAYAAGSLERLYWVEGEKKALTLDQEGFAAIGLTGVWNWGDAARRKAEGGYHLHPRITDHVAIAGREHVVVFDQDAMTNREVMRAARRLAGLLLKAGAASVHFVTPPDYQPAKGVDDYYVSAGAEALRTLLTDDPYPLDPRDPDDTAADAALDALEYAKGAPGITGLVMPRGYTLSDTGRLLCNVGERVLEVTSRAMFIVRRLTDSGTQDEWAEVIWRGANGWRRTMCTRKALFDARTMVSELTPRGAPVTSHNARHLVSWLAAFEQVNEARLPMRKLIGRTGWLGSAFVASEAMYIDQDPLLDVHPDLERIAAALKPRGTLEAHLVALREAWAASDLMRLTICAALAAPLLTPLGVPGFALHLCGDSSRGKTTMLRIAASIYGDPTDTNWVASWNSTANAVELRASKVNDLPQFYDELGAANLEQVQKLVYTLVNGESRARMTRDITLRGALSWRTAVISSGELQLSDERMAVGAQARVIDVIVEGWGALDGNAQRIDDMRRECAANSGAVGLEWLSLLLSNTPARWAQLDADLRAIRARLTAAGGLKQRQAEHQAVLRLTQTLAEQAFGFAVCDDVAAIVGDDSNARDEVQSAADQMIEALSDWIATRPANFPKAELNQFGAFKCKVTGPLANRFGVQIVDSEGHIIETLLSRGELKSLCAHHGKTYSHVLREWANRGWIAVAKAGEKRRFDFERTEEGQGRSRWIVWRGPAEPVGDEK